ncbi:MAG TPA: hypothetical protein VEL12_02035 [Candidatus Nitrosopolaris sp.]|nr:hypothetical protein [Candidatus Nitrosopolaris sp.]
MRQLLFFGELFVDAVDFVAAAGRLGAAFAADFAAGLGFAVGAGAGAATAGAGAGGASDSTVSGAGSVAAMPIELEMVR